MDSVTYGGLHGVSPDFAVCLLSSSSSWLKREREREREARVDVGIEAGHVVGFLCGTDKISIYTESSIYR